MQLHQHPRMEAPIVIIGNGGSGSSLLNQMLDAHPDIAMRGEMKFLIPRAWAAFREADANTSLRNLERHFDVVPDLEARITGSPSQFQEFLRTLERDEFLRMGAVLRQAVAAWFCLTGESARFWGFKEIMNGNHYRYDWGIYDHVFPEACWVHILRHPAHQVRAAARLSNQPLSAATAPALLHNWLAIVEMSRQRVHTGHYHEIRYEDLIRAPQRTLTPLLDALGLGWHEDCRLPMGRQWGAASERAPLPANMEKLISATDGLRELMSRVGYPLQETAEADAPLEPKPLPAHIETLGRDRWKLFGMILREVDQCWVFDLPQKANGLDLAAIADDVGSWQRSPLRLFENETLLAPAHALHFRIRAFGGGAYSHWQNRLLFSTSDNSNPNSNGCVYSFDLKG